MSKKTKRPAPPAQPPAPPVDDRDLTSEALENAVEFLKAAVVQFGYPVTGGGVAIAVTLLDPNVKTRFVLNESSSGQVLIGVFPVVDEAPVDPAEHVKSLEEKIARLEKELAAKPKPSDDDDVEVEAMIQRGRGI